MIYDCSTQKYRLFLRTEVVKKPLEVLRSRLIPRLALRILHRDHGTNFRNPTLFTKVLKQKIAVGLLAEKFFRYGNDRECGLCKEYIFTANEIRNFARVLVAYFVMMWRLKIYTHEHRGLWNYLFKGLLFASGLSSSQECVVSLRDVEVVADGQAGSPGTFAVRNMSERADVFGDLLRNLPGTFLSKRIADNTCWYCNINTLTKTQKCGMCKVAHYCSRNCQKRDWLIHNRHCEILSKWSHAIIKSRRRTGKESMKDALTRARVEDRKAQLYNYIVLRTYVEKCAVIGGDIVS